MSKSIITPETAIPTIPEAELPDVRHSVADCDLFQVDDLVRSADWRPRGKLLREICSKSQLKRRLLAQMQKDGAQAQSKITLNALSQQIEDLIVKLENMGFARSDIEATVLIKNKQAKLPDSMRLR
jgi:hypothetical protein